MSAERDSGQSGSRSARGDLGGAPSWEDAPARTGSREERSAEGSSAAQTAPGSTAERTSSPSEAPAQSRRERRRRSDSPNMLPGRAGRSAAERLLVRVIATCGIVGIGVVIAAIMVSSHSSGWIVGLVVSVVSVVLAAILWSSRTL